MMEDVGKRSYSLTRRRAMLLLCAQCPRCVPACADKVSHGLSYISVHGLSYHLLFQPNTLIAWSRRTKDPWDALPLPCMQNKIP